MFTGRTALVVLLFLSAAYCYTLVFESETVTAELHWTFWGIILVSAVLTGVKVFWNKMRNK